jgi:NAD(P)-dependent dehydrogenase (short-subunit alcohol dehydrogenase family)
MGIYERLKRYCELYRIEGYVTTSYIEASSRIGGFKVKFDKHEDGRMSLNTLKDQRVVILGGSSGIGFAVAKALSLEGAHVLIGSSSKDKVNAAIGRLGSLSSGMVVDVQDECSVASFFKEVGAFDHLVFTAGDDGASYHVGPVGHMDLAGSDHGLKVRFWGALAAIKHAQPNLSANGSITLTDGVLSFLPRKGMFLASAFSGAVQSLIRGLAVDLSPLRVNSVCPGLVLTERVLPWGQDAIDQSTNDLPIPRAGQPSEVAEAYLYLMRGGYTTGQVIVVDGGRCLI